MARINLLPWREELRRERQKQYLTLVSVFAALTLLVWGVVHVYHSGVIDYRRDRIDRIDNQIADLDKKIGEIKQLEKEKERLLSRMYAIERLQSNRPLVVRLFDEVVDSIPEGVSLEKLMQKDAKITINGVAQSNARISSFMRNVEKSSWLKDPELEIIQTKREKKEGPKANNFILRFEQEIPKPSEEEGEGGEV